MQQQQQQQHADFDLLAVFSEESTADAAEAKLHKEGFGEEEVFRLAPGTVGKGEFREHGPNRERSSVFLQTRRAGPNPRLIVIFALIFGVVLGGLSFGVLDLTVHGSLVWPITLLGVLVGIVLGALLGLTRRGKVRGAIGQDMSKVRPAETPRKVENEGARTVVAVKLPDPDNISRKSRARAILLNNGGKIDRSVGRAQRE